MWWRVNFSKLVTLLVPVCLRGGVLVQFLKCMVAPVAYLHDLWLDFYNKEWTRVNVVPRVDVLEKYLRKESGVNSLTIDSPDVQKTPPLYFESENGTKTIIYKESEGETPYYIGDEFYVPKGETIIIHVPISTTLVKIKKIKEIMNIFKPCGRSYKVIAGNQ